jgi:hypothetical protein
VIRIEQNAAAQDVYVLKFSDNFTDVARTDNKNIRHLLPQGVPNNALYIDVANFNTYYWILKSELIQLINDGFVIVNFETGKYKPTFGATVSLPFKYRPKVDDLNVKITPDVTLGGFLGGRIRLSRTEAYYISLPVWTLGLTTLAINDNNNPSDPEMGDGLVLGITTSLGVIIELDDFQLGLLVGWDRAAGELGKNWIYNDKAWYSFSVGYTFVGANAGKPANTTVQ